MTQNLLTVTAANPTPPTNLIFVGNTPSLDWLQPYADDGITAAIRQRHRRRRLQWPHH